MLLGIVSVQVGSALAKHLFDAVGSFGTVALRLFFAAAVLMLLWRPSLRMNRRTWTVVLGYGVILGLMNLCFYLALARLPLGIAVTIEFLGPLAVALAGSRRWLDAFWAVLAAGGVVLLMEGGGDLDLVGLLFALAAGTCWGLYILVGAALGRHTTEGNGLALGMAVAALVAVPSAWPTRDGADPAVGPGRGARRGAVVLGDPVLAGSGSAAQDPAARVRHPDEPRTRDGGAHRPHRALRSRCTGRSGSRCSAWSPPRRAPPAAPADPRRSRRRLTTPTIAVAACLTAAMPFA